MNDSFYTLDATAQAELVRSGQVSPIELVDAAIARIESVDQQVHALASCQFEAARERARLPLTGAFAGVPFLIKDLLGYKGFPQTFGSRLFRSNIAHAGSPYADRITEAGLVTLGNTTTSELGLLGSTESLAYGVTHNPWSLNKSATGSSGGAAAAVAAGMVPMAHASDGGGSIRIPASASGLFGLKPSRGRTVSTGQNFAYDLLCEHVITRSVRDSALFLSNTERHDGPLSPVGFVARPKEQRLRIGFYTQTTMGDAPSAEVKQALMQTAKICEALGHELIEAPAPVLDGPNLSKAFFVLAGAAVHGLAELMEPMLGRKLGDQDLEPFTLSLLSWFRCLPPDALARAVADCDAGARAMASFLEQYDVVLCPTIPHEPPDLGTLSPTLDRELVIRRTEQLAGYTAIHNIAGVPAMNVPLVWSASGLPLGSHFAARIGAEETLLSLAYQLEAAAPWRDKWAPGFGPAKST